MSQNFLFAKGSLKPQTDITQLQQQIAQMFANNNQDQQNDPLRETVSEIVKTKLMKPVEVPQYTTLADVLNAKKGEGLKTFADFLDNPETMRTIGDFLPKYGYNPETGKMRNLMEDKARKQEALMQAQQEKAIDEEKMQNALASNMYGDFVHQDIANMNDKRMRELAKEELEWKSKENALDRGLQREQMAQQERLSRLIHSGGGGRSGGGSATGGASGLSKKELDTLSSLNAIRGQLDRFSNTFGNLKHPYRYRVFGKASELVNTLTPSEANFNSQRTLLFNKIARELGGEKGVLSDQDIKRIEAALPTLSDTTAQKKAKMRAVYNLLDDRMQQFGITSSPQPPNVDMNAINAELKKRGIK